MAVPSVPCHQISEGISFRSAVDRSHILQPLIEEEDTLIVFLGEPRDLTLLCSSTAGQSWGTPDSWMGSRRSGPLDNPFIVVQKYTLLGVPDET